MTKVQHYINREECHDFGYDYHSVWIIYKKNN